MPILHSIIHRIDKGNSETPAQLVPAATALPASDALEDLVSGLTMPTTARPRTGAVSMKTHLPPSLPSWRLSSQVKPISRA